jgi:hypothetical protein
MVISAKGPNPRHHTAAPRGRCGALITELVVAMAMLTGVLLPVAYAFAAETRVARATYERAVAIEIIDGEMELLLAGERQAFAPGKHRYEAQGRALTNLPPGLFVLVVETNRVRLEWQPSDRHQGGPVVREVMLQ